LVPTTQSGRDRPWSSERTTDYRDGDRASRFGDRQGNGEPRAIGPATRTTESALKGANPAKRRRNNRRTSVRQEPTANWHTSIWQRTATTTPGTGLGGNVDGGRKLTTAAGWNRRQGNRRPGEPPALRRL
jgi:hypothetical protein